TGVQTCALPILTENRRARRPQQQINWMQRHVALRQAPRTRPLIAMPSRGRPMSIQISGHGLVSNAENTEMVAYSINTKANQHASATFRPHQTLVGLVRAIRTASV